MLAHRRRSNHYSVCTIFSFRLLKQHFTRDCRRENWARILRVKLFLGNRMFTILQFYTRKMSYFPKAKNEAKIKGLFKWYKWSICYNINFLFYIEGVSFELLKCANADTCPMITLRTSLPFFFLPLFVNAFVILQTFPSFNL